MSKVEKTNSRFAMVSLQLLSLWQTRRLLRRSILSLITLFVAVGLFGFLAAPSLLRGVLEDALSDALHRSVSIGAVSVNPYALSLAVEKLSVKDREDKGGGELFGVDRLYVNLESVSLWHGGPVLRELAVEGPRLVLTRAKDGRYNVSDLIDEWMAKPASPGAVFSLNNIHVSHGHFSFVDALSGSHHELTELALSLPFLSSLPYQTEIFVEPAFTATIDGAAFALKGKSKPFSATHESELGFDLDGFDLMRIAGYLPATLPVRLASGKVDGDIHLSFKAADKGVSTLLLNGRLALHQLAVQTAKGQPLLTAKKIDSEIVDLDVFGRRVELKHLLIDQPDIRLSRDADGAWLGVPADRAQSESKNSGKGSKAEGKRAPDVRKSTSPGWRLQAAEARIANGKLQLRDASVGGDVVVETRLDRLDLSLKHLDSAAGKAEVTGQVHINDKGALSVRGPLALSPLAADLKLEWQNLALLPFQPYFAERLNASLAGGQLSGNGQLQLQPAGKGDAKKTGGELAVQFAGDATVGNFDLLDANRISLLNWKSLYFGAIDLRLQPAQPLFLNIGEVALSDFQARADVAPDGKLNLAQLIKPAAKAMAPAPTAVAPTPAATPVAAPISLKIGKVTLQGGRVAFTDRFIKPGYTARLTGVGGRIGELQPLAGSAADFELRGKVDNSAPLVVAGRINPLLAQPYLDLKATVRGFDLSPLSPYAGKFAGYGISKGKLSLDVSYHLEANKLQANNRLFLDQLTFGERVDSPQATNLPVQLVVSLLKNRRGEIDLNLPIAGSLDDPQFSLGGVIVQVIVNLLEKAVTAPFSLIASLFSGGEELSYLDYPVGHAVLTPASLSRLAGLAKALEERPALRLDITGHADPEQDIEGLKHARLERKVRQQKAADKAREGGDSAEDPTVSSSEYPALLKRAYDAEKFPKPRNLIGMAKSLPAEEMEKLMLANITVNEQDIRNLASRRAQVVRDWLVEQGKVDPERLFLVAPKVEAAAKGDSSSLRAEFALK